MKSRSISREMEDEQNLLFDNVYVNDSVLNDTSLKGDGKRKKIFMIKSSIDL